MKKKILYLLTVFLLTGNLSYGQSNSRDNLKPLHSTRSDVEKIYGQPYKTYDRDSFLYKTSKGNILVTYTTRKCEEGWNVSIGSVLNIKFSPDSDAGKSADELELDRNKFSFSADDATYGYWTDAHNGVEYTFSNFDQELISVTYIPKKSDNHLRCEGFPPYAPEGKHLVTLDSFLFYNPYVADKKEGLNSVLARFNHLVISVKDFKTFGDYKGYVLVYYDDKLSFKEYEKRLEKVKDYIYRERKVKPDDIAVIEGGMRDESQVELYVLPRSWHAPSPEPTLPSPQFAKKKKHATSQKRPLMR